MLGALLITVYGSGRVYADVQRQRGIAVFAQARSVAGAAPDQPHWSDGRIRAYARAFASEPQTLPEAVLRIPGVKLAVPVYADTSGRNL